MKKEIFLKALGKQAKKIRISKGMALYALAKNTGITYRTMQRFEKGEMNISLNYLCKIASELDVPLEVLIKGLL